MQNFPSPVYVSIIEQKNLKKFSFIYLGILRPVTKKRLAIPNVKIISYFEKKLKFTNF
jgi:hypothetical protein